MAEILETIDWSPLFISLKTGILATVLAFFAGIAAGYDWNRTVYHARGDAVCTVPEWKFGKDIADGVHFAAVVSVCADSFDDSAGNDSSGRQRIGIKGRRKCCHAESLTGFGKKKIRSV